MESPPTKKDQPLSPASSDKSSESEGRPVREKLKETRIDAHGTTDPVPAADQTMHDAHTNGTAAVDPSTSGSDSERGRLRRKRSRENFEADEKTESDQKPERHVRKKSRDIPSPKELDTDSTAPLAQSAAPLISQQNGGDAILSQDLGAVRGQGTPEAELSDKHADGVASPKNKRTREQAEAGAEAAVSRAAESTKDSAAASGTEDERTTKRPRDAVGTDAAETAASNAKIRPGSGFANTSATSPFADIAAKPQTSKVMGAPGKDLPQTSSEAFKKSGFGALASATSPFAAASTGGSSPFGSATGSKLSSFASPGKAPSAASGFAALGSKPVPSSFGGFNSTSSPSGFAAVAKTSTGGGFGGFGGFGSAATKSSFGTGTTITGLSQTTEKPFGSREEDDKSDDEDGDGDDEGDADGEDGTATEPRTSQPLLQSQPPPETGEENEETVWTGRAKLYKLVGEGSKKAWTERGVGAIKLNVTREEPIKARFVLRADGTHRLLLNAAVTAGLRFGNVEGKKPEDGRILFNTPTASGEVESYTLRMKAERATDLWTTVEAVKKDL